MEEKNTVMNEEKTDQEFKQIEKRPMKTKLSFKFAVVMAVEGLLIMVATLLVGVRMYSNGIISQYNDEGFRVAAMVESVLSEEDLKYEADLVYRYNYGEADNEELQKELKNKDYIEAVASLDRIRGAVGANDIFIVAMDYDVLKKYTPEGKANKEWNPMYYIADSYTVPDLRFNLGDAGSINDTQVGDAIKACENTKWPDNYIILKSDFGFNITSMHALYSVDDDYTVFIGVEIPMSTLRGEIYKFVTHTSVAISIVTIIILIIFVYNITKYMIRPMVFISEAVADFVKNDNKISWKLQTINTGDELQQLSDNLLKMEMDINNYISNIRKVTAEKERIGAELDVARNIQANMLPSIFPPFPDRNEFEIYATMDPAKEVGGDFYDFFLLDGDRLAMVMADVSGKGVPAALFMVIAKTLIKNCAQQCSSPAEILQIVNNQLCENNSEEMFVTVWLGILDLKTGVIKSANAGHEYPALRTANGNFELVKDPHGLVLAGMEGLRYKEFEMTIEHGGALFLYTDGVPEATNAHKELYGTDRMLSILNSVRGMDVKTVLERVREDIDKFVGEAEQFDDITMIIFRYL